MKMNKYYFKFELAALQKNCFKMQVNEKRKRISHKKRKPNDLGLRRRKIPKKKLKNALAIINDPENDIWKNRNMACETDIHNYRQSCVYNYEPNDILHMEFRLRYAQTCLLRRDWNNLAKIILLYKPDKSNEHLLRVFAKYASICLAYTNQPLLKSLLQSFKCTNPIENVLEKWTSITDVECDDIDDEFAGSQ